MIENEKQDLTTSLPPLVDAQPNLLDPSVEVKDEKYFADLKRAGDYRDALIEEEEEKFLELYKIGLHND